MPSIGSSLRHTPLSSQADLPSGTGSLGAEDSSLLERSSRSDILDELTRILDEFDDGSSLSDELDGLTRTLNALNRLGGDHTDGRSEFLAQPSGPPRGFGGMAGLWRRDDPNHPTSGGYSRTAKQSIFSSPKEPEPAVVEEQPTAKNGQQS